VSMGLHARVCQWGCMRVRVNGVACVCQWGCMRVRAELNACEYGVGMCVC